MTRQGTWQGWLGSLAVTVMVGLPGCGSTAVMPSPGGTDAGGGTTVDGGTAGTDAGGGTPVDAGPPTADVTPVADAGTAPDVPEPPVMASSCDMVHAGTVDGFMVDGVARQFIVTLPTGATAAGGHWPVVFNWHGLGDTAANMNQLLAGSVNNTTLPFILVTPESEHLLPTTTPIGLEWDELQIHGPNQDARLFDAVLQCVDTNWGVNRDRVYTVGFSAGGIMSDLLAVLRGDQLAAVVTYSGGYFADPANPATLGVLHTFVSWPDLTTTNRYTQLLMFGGTMDTFSLVVAQAHFDQFAANDAMWLNGMGHDTILCNHGTGHMVPPGVLGRQLVEFFNAHPRGTALSPFAHGLPADYPSYCTFQGHTGTM